MEKAKKLPRGKSDFAQIRRENMYYVDKSMYIEKLSEFQDYVILNRPRRFGKSLFISMLERYYDLNTTDEEFDELFKGLYIYDHKTEEAQSYMIWHLDFSKVSPGMTYEETEKSFGEYIKIRIKLFVEKYSSFFSEETISTLLDTTKDWHSLTEILISSFADKGKFIYLVIDEYDNFTNTIMSKDPEQYLQITHSVGFLRSFFKLCKNLVVNKILVVGVLPVTHDDLTSGLGYCEPLGYLKDFNAILGFTETEVREMVDYYQQYYHFSLSTEEIVGDMKQWYDNYCFSEEALDEDRMFNTDAVIMYLVYLKADGKAPKYKLDHATAVDWDKIMMLSDINAETECDDNVTVIQRLMEDGYYDADLEGRFDMRRMREQEIFPSLLYYFGLVTIGDASFERLRLIIPNNNIRYQFYQHFIESYSHTLDYGFINKTGDLVGNAARTGEWKPLFTMILTKWKEVSSVRQTIDGERAMQAFTLALLSMSKVFLMKPEIELNKGYADIVLFPDFLRYKDVPNSFIIELKVAKKDADKETVEKIYNEAVGQVNDYADDPIVPNYVRTSKLHKCIIIMKGWEIERMEEV